MTKEDFESYYAAEAPLAVKRLIGNTHGNGFSPEVAEDAVQEAALYMLERLERLNPRGGGYLFRVARDRALAAIGSPKTHGNKRVSRLLELPFGSANDLTALETPDNLLQGDE